MSTVTGTGPHASFDFADQVRQRIQVVVLAAAVLTADSEDNHPSHTIRPVCYVELVTSRLIFFPPALDLFNNICARLSCSPDVIIVLVVCP